MQLSWIDADNMRELAAKLQDPPPARPVVVIEPPSQAPLLSDEAPPLLGEIPSPTSPNDAQLARIREQLLSIRTKAVKAGLLAAEPALPAPQIEEMPSSPPQPIPVESLEETEPEAVVAPPITPPAQEVDPMSARLNEFAERALKLTRSDEMILIDDHGGLLWGNSLHTDLSIAATLAMTTALRASTQGAFTRPGVIRNRVSHDLELSVLPCDTKHGCVILVLINTQPLPYETITELRTSLVEAIEG